MKDVARATSAAPTYFEAAGVKNETGTPYPLIDGGVFANNPSIVAYSKARTMKFKNKEDFPQAKNMVIVSVGTGSKSKSYEYKKVKDWGQIGWIKPIIEIMMSGSSSTTDYHLKQIFDTLDQADKEAYYRLEPKVISADAAMDNATVDNLKKLEEDALTYVADGKVDKQLDGIAKKLIANK